MWWWLFQAYIQILTFNHLMKRRKILHVELILNCKWLLNTLAIVFICFITTDKSKIFAYRIEMWNVKIQFCSGLLREKCALFGHSVYWCVLVTGKPEYTTAFTFRTLIECYYSRVIKNYRISDCVPRARVFIYTWHSKLYSHFVRRFGVLCSAGKNPILLVSIKCILQRNIQQTFGINHRGRVARTTGFVCNVVTIITSNDKHNWKKREDKNK